MTQRTASGIMCFALVMALFAGSGMAMDSCTGGVCRDQNGWTCTPTHDTHITPTGMVQYEPGTPAPAALADTR